MYKILRKLVTPAALFLLVCQFGNLFCMSIKTFLNRLYQDPCVIKYYKESKEKEKLNKNFRRNFLHLKTCFENYKIKSLYYTTLVPYPKTMAEILFGPIKESEDLMQEAIKKDKELDIPCWKIFGKCTLAFLIPGIIISIPIMALSLYIKM